MCNLLLKITIIPFLLWTCIVESTNFLDLSMFQTELLNFLDEKNRQSISQSMDSDLLDEEFLLVEEFANLQLPRRRSIIKGMERDERWTPYRENRVTLEDKTEMSASYIQLAQQGDDRYHRFIASQAPFRHNIHLFWKMIWENQMDQVVMLTEIAEEPNHEKCAPYWPENGNDPLVLQNGMTIRLIEDSLFLSEWDTYIQKRKFLVSYERQQRVVIHYWYHEWMDHTIPDQPETLLTLIQTVSHDKQHLNSTAPILVHCMSGVGRTGIFITLYHIKQKQIYAEPIHLFELALQLRWQRPKLMSKLAAYRYCYEMIPVLQESK